MDGLVPRLSGSLFWSGCTVFILLRSEHIVSDRVGFPTTNPSKTTLKEVYFETASPNRTAVGQARP